MKIENINNRFAMPSFGVGKKIKRNKSKKNIDISSIISNISTIIPTQKTSQMLREQFETHNQINLPQQQALPQKTTQINTQSIDEYCTKIVDVPCSLSEISFDDYIKFTEDPILSSPTLNPGIFNDEQFPTQKEIIKNKILENRIQHKNNLDIEHDKTNEFEIKKRNVSVFFSKFLPIIKKAKYKKFNPIKKQLTEICSNYQHLFENIIPNLINLYQHIHLKRTEDSDYELSKESFDDNNKLLEMSKNGKSLSNSIVTKINSPGFQRTFIIMESFFSQAENRKIINAFQDCNDISLYQEELFDSEIEYRKKYLEIIREAVIFNADKDTAEATPFIPSFTYDTNMMPSLSGEFNN